MIDVLIVDDHPVMRELLRQILERYPDVSVVADAGLGEDAVSHATHFQPGVALIDVNLPTMSGIETTRMIKMRSPLTAIIGLTAGEPNDTDMTMISAGASVVISKADLVHCLYPAILEAVKGLKAAI
jgi:two-component system invasion response regulator UvrY